MKKIAYLKKLLYFAYQHNPILSLFPFISIASILAELLAMMTLVPLAMLASNQNYSPHDPLFRFLNIFNITPTSKLILMTFISLVIFRIITNVISQNIALKYGKRILSQLATSAFKNIVKYCQLDQIEKKSIGHYISLAGDESFRASNIVIEMHQLSAVLVFVGLYYGLILWYFPMVAIFLIFFMLFSYVMMYSSFRKTHTLGVLQIAQSKSAGTIFLDTLNGLRTVRSFSAEDFVISEYQTKMKSYTSTLFKIDFINVLIKFIPIIFLFGIFFIGIISGLFDKYVSHSLNITLIVTVLLFLMRFFPVVGQALSILMKFIADFKAAQDVSEIIHYNPISHKGNIIFNDKINSLTVSELQFAYLRHKPVFDKLTYEFKAGKSYAVLGPSGIGKSTFFNILSFLTFPQSGEILINNLNYQTLELNSLRKKIILVEQESIIFNETILTNITLGEEYSFQKIIEACKIACIDDFVNQLPEKYHSILNYQGQNISGGQRQRIGIARAVLRDPEVLLLDEITSALDEVTKRKILDNILNHFKDKIVIFITHDSAVIENVDTILNLDASGIIEIKPPKTSISQATLGL